MAGLLALEVTRGQLVSRLGSITDAMSKAVGQQFTRAPREVLESLQQSRELGIAVVQSH